MVLINCVTKGCLQQTEAKLNRDSKEVICEQCGNTIPVTEQMKRTLASVGQVLRSKIVPFQQHCSACKVMRSLHVSGNAAYCEHCNTQITVTPAFLQGLKLHLEREKKFKNEGIE
jgi:hypothetical protein